MTKFQNLKIAITDNDHLKAVCDVLEQLGYESGSISYGKVRFAYANSNGFYGLFFGDYDDHIGLVTLSDLLKMRDEMAKHNAKSSQE